ncbi:MAG TPA: hypothetical protein VFJ58_03065 [Armatimonadota bacterium]|nr:hypothetical protein [Armatimonadota bacterium]
MEHSATMTAGGSSRAKMAGSPGAISKSRRGLLPLRTRSEIGPSMPNLVSDRPGQVLITLRPKRHLNRGPGDEAALLRGAVGIGAGPSLRGALVCAVSP